MDCIIHGVAKDWKRQKGGEKGGRGEEKKKEIVREGRREDERVPCKNNKIIPLPQSA